MLTTRTGNVPIGFRRLKSPWQRDPANLIEWALQQKLSLIDLGDDALVSARAFLDAGMRIGSADLPEWSGMITADTARRRDAVQRNVAYIQACTALPGPGGGIRNFFVAMLPDDPAAPRRESFNQMIESLNELTPTLEKSEANLVIESWPGSRGTAFCCTPETVRATLKECSSKRIGLNYDPSHLVRMHIDPLRFLQEFADRVYHIHGKDTEILSENLYEYGWEQTPTFGKPRNFGWVTWRYCIPGHGNVRWTRTLEILASRNYKGAISVELEDESFNGSESGEKAGINAAAQFLATC